jgi:hypothetical protein
MGGRASNDLAQKKLMIFLLVPKVQRAVIAIIYSRQQT